MSAGFHYWDGNLGMDGMVCWSGWIGLDDLLEMGRGELCELTMISFSGYITCSGGWKPDALGVGWALGWCLGVGVLGGESGSRIPAWGDRRDFAAISEVPTKCSWHFGMIPTVWVKGYAENMAQSGASWHYSVKLLDISYMFCWRQAWSVSDSSLPMFMISLQNRQCWCDNTLYKLSMRSRNWFKVLTNSNHQTMN